MGGAHRAEQISFSQWAWCTCTQEGELYGAVRYQEWWSEWNPSGWLHHYIISSHCSSQTDTCTHDNSSNCHRCSGTLNILVLFTNAPAASTSAERLGVGTREDLVVSRMWYGALSCEEQHSESWQQEFLLKERRARVLAILLKLQSFAVDADVSNTRPFQVPELQQISIVPNTTLLQI
jgi:hypothetical protein